jgi:DNA invertase Pin-like site-specific DNA recombinase
MLADIPHAGAANAQVRNLVHQVWIETANSRNIDIAGFDANAALSQRLAWATAHGFSIGGVLSRFSIDLQQSTTAQVRDNVQYAASHAIYVPPEYVCVDEAETGRKVRRDGLERMTTLLRSKRVQVLLVFKVSRLFRVGYRGLQYFKEELVEEGLRGISITQGIDTNDEKVWKQLMYMHGMMDEMLLDTIADHVRSGLGNLFRSGFVTGALTVGYEGVEVPGAPTKRGLPRRIPAKCERTAQMILEHFQMIHDGLPIVEGWKRWVAAGGPCDARSSGQMSYAAYRRMLSNMRYIGIWAFGRKRNRWSSKRDYNQQIEQPETEIIIVRCEDLRILPDALFFDVQRLLAQLKTGPRGPKGRREPQLWDLVTDCFHCAICSTDIQLVRFYQAGAGGLGMRCKRAQLCPCSTIVRRKEAVRYVCEELSTLLNRDADMITDVIVRSRKLDGSTKTDIESQVKGLDRAIASLGRKISDLSDLSGEGTEEDRKELKDKIRGARTERTSKQAERAILLADLMSDVTITPDNVRSILKDLTGLLEQGAAGKIGSDAVHRAAEVFRRMVGGRILVHVHQREGRKSKTVSGSFVPRLLMGVQGQLGLPAESSNTTQGEVRAWLRKPPRVDRLAFRAHVLIDDELLSFRDAAKVLS